MTGSDPEPLLQEQISYYRARAPEYDEWFLRKGRYDRGPELNGLWFREIAEVRDDLDKYISKSDILELASGTGLWTQQLVKCCDRVTAVDASPETLEINRHRVRSDRVEYVLADLYQWRPKRAYDMVFFSFWLSHVPQERFESFWKLVGSALKPGGVVFFVDSLYSKTSPANDHQMADKDSVTTTRKLNDGRSFRILKIFYDPEKLEQKLTILGWNSTVKKTANYFLYGYGEKIE